MSSDLLILGSGITALSTAYHLKLYGIQNVTCIIFENNWKPITGYAIAGQWDNFSRYHHSHGAEIATALWAMGNEGYESLSNFAKNEQVTHHKGRRLRLLLSEHELKEAKIANRLLKQCGFTTELTEGKGDYSTKVLGVQEDPLGAIWIDPEDLKEKLLAKSQAQVIYGKVEKIIESKGKIEISLLDGGKLAAEMVVLGTHLESCNFFPHLKKIAIAVADQQTEFACECANRGDFISANHGHYWFSMQPGQIVTGGARFLRKFAGIGEEAPPVLEKVSEHQQKIAQNIFPRLEIGKRLGSQAYCDIIPQDELPLIGPLNENPRILLGTGYSFSGLANGFAAGAELAKVINDGHSEKLKWFGMERFRGL